MAGDDLGIVYVQAAEFCAYAGHELMGCAVGAVTAYAVFLIILIGQAVHICVGRHCLVECGIEGDNLGDRGKGILHSPDTKKVGGVVERGEIRAELYLSKDVLIHEDRSGEEIAALHDAVTHGFDVFERLQDAGLGVCEGSQDKLHTHFVVRDWNVCDNFVLAGGRILEDTGGKADFLCYTLGNNVKHIVALHIKKLVLDGRTAAVDN